MGLTHPFLCLDISSNFQSSDNRSARTGPYREGPETALVSVQRANVSSRESRYTALQTVPHTESSVVQAERRGMLLKNAK